ncbi:MAG TPA: hypothetical protein VNF68_11150 [Candidatus Baltobacteraceae bacterium]|nr:hypothetical protein [Candidatus Baltobacteraceae bacterium]
MTTRKDFLAASAAIGALAPQVALAADAEPAATPVPLPHLNFELTAFDASLGRPAKHKHLFTSKKIENGDIFGGMAGTIFAYNAIGIPLSEVSLAGVLYHGISVFFAFDDAIWRTYIVPYMAKGNKSVAMGTDFSSVTSHGGNPCLHTTGGADDQSIETLISQVGMRLYACNRAVGGMVHAVAKFHKLDPSAVYTEFAAHLVPNAMLVPAGVWGVHAVQERGFTLLEVV